MLTLVIVTLGLYILVNSPAGWIWGFGNRSFPGLFGDGVVRPRGRADLRRVDRHRRGAARRRRHPVRRLQRTKVGLAMRAVSMNPDSSRLVGISVGRTLMIGWGIAALVGALAGALIAPRLFLDVNFMGGVLIYSFAAATLGGFDSPFGAVLGGWIIGIAENLAGTYVDFIGSDLKILVPLIVDPRGAAVPAHRPVRLRGGGQGMSAKRMRLAGWGARDRPGRAAAVLLRLLPGRPVHAGDGARDRGARAEPARRLQRADLARPRRVLRARART